VNLAKFFSELKRRNVYKVAVAYAVVSWLLIQAASIFFPAFDAPAWVMKIFIIVIIFGFPVALIFSWAFEITPEGIKLESEIEPSKSVTRRTGRKIVAVTIALAVLAAGLFVYQLVRSKPTVAPRQSEAATAAPNKSIAVLPFDNLSRDSDNAYFCEDVQDEILTRLAKVAIAHQWFGECLQSQGRVKEGLAELRRAQEVDPLSLVNNALVGFALDTVGKTSEAIAQLRRTIEMEPNFANSYGLLGNVLEAHGQLKEAIVEYEKNISLGEDPIDLAQLGRAYFLIGRKAEAQQLWDKLKALSERQYVPAYSLALVQLAFGDKDAAIRSLEKSYQDHAPFDSADLGWILIDHRLDDLRSDPRFKQLITRIFSGKPR